MLTIRATRAPVAAHPFSTQKRAGSPWNPERDAELERLWLGKVPARQIAEELGDGITKNAVIGRVWRIGLPTRRGRPAPGTRNCRVCSANLDRTNRSGYCKNHWRSRLIAADPLEKERARAAANRNFQTPKAAAARREAAVRSQAWKAGLAAVTPEHRKLAGARSRATKLAWCPPELRDTYVFLIRRRRFKAAEAREIVLRQHETDMARFRRRIGAA